MLVARVSPKEPQTQWQGRRFTVVLSLARKYGDEPRAGGSRDGGRILSIGRIVQKGFQAEMEFELGLDDLGIGHEVEKVGRAWVEKSGTSRWTYDICGKWQQCGNLECGMWQGQ